MCAVHVMRHTAEAMRKALARRLRRSCIKLQCAIARVVQARRGIFHAK
jgi:hypothetical protein